MLNLYKEFAERMKDQGFLPVEHQRKNRTFSEMCQGIFGFILSSAKIGWYFL
jgi:hypothetical protein